DDEVAGRPAVRPRLAFAFEADLRAVLDPGRNLHGVALRAPFTPGAVAVPARPLDDRSVAVAARARAGEGEEALVLGDDAAAAALGTDLRGGSGLGSRAVADGARNLEVDGDLRLETLERVLERDVDRHLDVAASLTAPALRGAARCARVPEDAPEEVAQVPEVADVARPIEVAPRPGPAGAAEDTRTDLVVLLALLGIREDVVGALDLFEALLGRLVVRVLVRMVLPRELPVGLLDLIRRGVLLDAQHLIEVLHSPCDTTTRAGRRTRSPSR